ncbi:MAG: ribosome small subunit-dependent GTPase A [Actinomycetaceae bacterium]|nr:ribosome small subunit-dependent GTPase A [Actinomycetaceae bacterium]
MVRRDIGTDDPRVRVRPGRGSRPRTKVRPNYGDRPLGRVIGVDRGRFTVDVQGRVVGAVKARELGRRGVIVGDMVRLTGDISGKEGTLARLVVVEARTTELMRSTEDDAATSRERPMVANATQLAIVTALADPPPRPGMIDRCLVAATAAGIDPLLVLTKTDLNQDLGILGEYQNIGIKVIQTAVTDASCKGITDLATILEGDFTVLVGHSGVGKSTLINALIPGADRLTGAVNAVTGRGRHTSTSAVALPLSSGWVVDTPGVRSFGLAHLAPEQILQGFYELSEVAASYCPRGCSHADDAPDCALDQLTGFAGARRDSFRKLLSSRLSGMEFWEK